MPLSATPQFIEMAKDATESIEGDNRGKLFKNENRKSDKHPEYSGPCIVNGAKMKMSAWVNESSTGKKYMAMRFSPVTAAST
jgi:hypothetical protein